MIKALELYLAENHDEEAQQWQGRLELISRKVTTLPGVATSYFVPDIANHVPHMEIRWDSRIRISTEDALAALRNSKPSIVLAIAEKNAVGEPRTGLVMNSFMLQPGEDAIIADRVYELLKTHST